ncbi:hypothetical protein OV079_01415 [Nannocystis pusilla]|uniref:Uncharacterized protein n=1 Tax=Nannocystis pusilla TaxID=889268 RepID=A0A9X3EHP3_9BACT|nr:hypothetical protein [Nannocystis pusilla]MCY1004247.1 hypothetical protein [Nannocystis pusilla]
MTTHGQVDELICQLFSLIQGLDDLYFGATHGFAGLSNRVLESVGTFGALTDNGFSTALGPPTSLNVGSAGSSGYILVDGVDEVSYAAIARMNCGDDLQGLYVFQSGTVMIDPKGEAIPAPALGTNILGASLDVIIAAWRDAVAAGDRGQVLLVLAPS